MRAVTLDRVPVQYQKSYLDLGFWYSICQTQPIFTNTETAAMLSTWPRPSHEPFWQQQNNPLQRHLLVRRLDDQPSQDTNQLEQDQALWGRSLETTRAGGGEEVYNHFLKCYLTRADQELWLGRDPAKSVLSVVVENPIVVENLKISACKSIGNKKMEMFPPRDSAGLC